MTSYDYVWLCMTICDYVWLCITMYDHVWPCMTLSGPIWSRLAVSGRVLPCKALFGYVQLCIRMAQNISLRGNLDSSANISLVCWLSVEWKLTILEPEPEITAAQIISCRRSISPTNSSFFLSMEIIIYHKKLFFATRNYFQPKEMISCNKK